MIPHLNVLTFSPLTGACSEGLDAFRFFFEQHNILTISIPDDGFTYLQSMDFQREPQSKHHLYCGQEKPAHYHGSLFLRLGTHQIQNRTRDAHKISPHGTMTKRTPAMNWDHAVSWGGGLG